MARPRGRRARPVATGLVALAAGCAVLPLCRLFLILPAASGWWSALQERPAAASPRPMSKRSRMSISRTTRRAWSSSLATALTGAVFGFFVAYAMSRRGAALDAAGADHIRRRGRQLRRRAAGLRLCRDAGHAQACITVFLKEHGLDIYQAGFTLYSLRRPGDRLHLLPDAA